MTDDALMVDQGAQSDLVKFDTGGYIYTSTIAPQRDSVVMLLSAQSVISSGARNLLLLSAYVFKIPRPFDKLMALSEIEGPFD